jgi:hypothetical protein
MWLQAIRVRAGVTAIALAFAAGVVALLVPADASA